MHGCKQVNQLFFSCFRPLRGVGWARMIRLNDYVAKCLFSQPPHIEHQIRCWEWCFSRMLVQIFLNVMPKSFPRNCVLFWDSEVRRTQEFCLSVMEKCLLRSKKKASTKPNSKTQKTRILCHCQWSAFDETQLVSHVWKFAALNRFILLWNELNAPIYAFDLRRGEMLGIARVCCYRQIRKIHRRK